MSLATESVNPVSPNFVNTELSTVDILNESAAIWSLATRIRRSTDFTQWSTENNTVGKGATAGDYVGDKRDYSEESYKTNFEVWMEIPNFILSAKILKEVDHLWIHLLLVQKLQTRKQQQQTLQHVKKNHENNMYKRTLIQTQVFRLVIDQF